MHKKNITVLTLKMYKRSKIIMYKFSSFLFLYDPSINKSFLILGKKKPVCAIFVDWHVSSVFYFFIIVAYIHSCNILFNFSISRGFAICSFIPALFASITSSVNAFAVIAMIGIHVLALSGRCLISCVAL